MHLVNREEDSRNMKRRRIALGLMTVFMAGYMAAGCGNALGKKFLGIMDELSCTHCNYLHDHY